MCGVFVRTHNKEKRMRKSIISLLVMLPLAAFAKGGGSEYFYQSETGKHDVTPRLSIDSSSLKYVGGSKATASANVLSAEYEYGWMDGVAVGAQLGYTFSGEIDSGTSTVDMTGLNNIEAFVKANLPAGPGTLRYGAALSLSLADSEVEANGDKNTATGGHDLVPYFGYEQSWDKCTFGAKLSLEVGLTDKTEDNNGTKTDFSGGEDTTIGLFYEHKFSEEMLLGISLDWVTTSDSKDETNGGAATENLSPTQVLGVYVPVKLGNGTLLPKLTYGMTTADEVGTSEVDSYSATSLSVGYRIEL
jgi:hypothetical protein